MAVRLKTYQTRVAVDFCSSDTAAKVPLMGTYLKNIQALNAAGASPPVRIPFLFVSFPES